MWTLERCWNIKALSPTVYGWNDNDLLYYSKTMDKALQVWYPWTHLDFNGICEEPFWGIERMVFWVDLKTSEYPGREQLTSWQVCVGGRCFQFAPLSYSLQKKLCPAGLEARQPKSSHQETLVLLTQPSVTYNHFLGPRILKWEEYCSWKHNLVVLTKWNTETESLWWTAHHYSGKVWLGIWEVRSPFPLSPRHCAREFRHSVSSNAHNSSRWVNYHD